MSEGTENRAAELTDEDVEKATGGGDITVVNCVQCPACGHFYSFTSRGDETPATPPCPSCKYRWDDPANPGGIGASANY